MDKASDSKSHEIVMKKFLDNGIRVNAQNFLCSYLADRMDSTGMFQRLRVARRATGLIKKICLI